jgi:DNA modification methylase
MPQLTIVYRKRTELRGYSRNSRTHSAKQVEQIAAAIGEWGWTNPILIDETGEIIAGHGRLMAAELRKMDEVPTITLAGLSQAQKQALVIADNKLAENAGWDAGLLAIELAELSDMGFDLGVVGFSDKELAALVPHAGSGGLTDPDAVPESKPAPIAVQGDVWLCGPHRVMCGDSCSPDDMRRLVGEGGVVDMWLTDPPYNVAYESKLAGSIKNDDMSDSAFRQFLRDAYVTANLVMRPGAVFYVWHADSEGYNFRGAARDAGWTVRQCLMWVKSQLVMGRQDYHWKHEPCLYGWKDDACTRPGCAGPVGGRCPNDEGDAHEPCLYGWKDGAAHLWMSDRKQTTVLQFDKPKRNGEHPTMKPVALFEYQMCNNTKPGSVVLDSFGGSGTTLIASEKNGRHARIMELDPKFVDVILRRWAEFTGLQPTLEGDGRTYAAIEAEARGVA